MKENPNDRIANDSDDGFQLLRQTLFRDKITFGLYEIKKKKSNVPLAILPLQFYTSISI